MAGEHLEDSDAVLQTELTLEVQQQPSLQMRGRRVEMISLFPDTKDSSTALCAGGGAKGVGLK